MSKGTTGSSGSSSHSHTHIHGGVTIGSPTTSVYTGTTASSTWQWVDDSVRLSERVERLERLLNVADIPTPDELENEAVRKAWEAYQETESEIFSVAFAELNEAKEELEIVKKLSKE